MSVTVGYTSQLKLALGVEREEIDVSTPCSVEHLMVRLLERHGTPLQRLVCDGAGQLQRSILVCIGDEQVGAGDNTPLNAGDSVTLIAPISGG